jgi:hypothetical protein
VRQAFTEQANGTQLVVTCAGQLPLEQLAGCCSVVVLRHCAVRHDTVG